MWKSIKNALPLRLRRRLKLLVRRLEDFKTGDQKRFAFSKKNAIAPPIFPAQIEATQPFHRADFVENKIKNIRRAATQIERVVIEPSQFFSFWKIIGEPSRRRGYLDGRTLKNGRLEADPGGGLCQLSGLVYWLALQAALPIRERHAHSIDIYTDASRFAPLGSDATVFYGYKDLRFENNLAAPLNFRFEINDRSMTAFLCSPLGLEARKVEFQVLENELGKQVKTLIFNDLEIVEPVGEAFYFHKT